MSKWPSPKSQSKKKKSCDWSQPGGASSSSSRLNIQADTEEEDDYQLCSCNDDEDDSDYVVCSKRNHLNFNDLGPKCWTESSDIDLKQIGSDKACQTNAREAHRHKTFPSTTLSDKIASEVESVEELCDGSKYLLCRYIFKDIIGSDLIYMGPFGNNLVTYLDYVATGRPLKCIEHYIRQYVMPTYSNTHTEVNYIAQQTSQLREEARVIIRECVKASDDDAVIFTGSGSTAAINKLIHAMDIRPQSGDNGPVVFVGPYEHHSNILPWRELDAKVVTIRQTQNGQLDFKHLTDELQKHSRNPKRLIMGAFSAASNVTGILTDANSVASLIHRYGGYAFFDYACAAPYVDIDMNPAHPQAYKDAIFISPHKFIGGPQTPGILVAKRWLFRNSVPHGVGGGTVVFVRRTSHSYVSNVESREEGGTPGIIESVRAGLVFKLKAAFTPKFIMAREREMLNLVITAWAKIPNLLILGNLTVERLPIFPLLFMNPDTGRFVHHDFIAKILNDVFGIQVRSGCACAGPYGMDLLGMEEKIGKVFEKLITVRPDDSDIYVHQSSIMDARNLIFKPGFVRLNFPYFISEECLNFVLKAIHMTSEKGWVLLPLYSFDRNTSNWWCRLQTNSNKKNSLHDVTFKSGQFGIKKSSSGKMCHFMSSGSLGSLTNLSVYNYDEILERAELIFTEAETPDFYENCDQTSDFTPEEEALRWFMLPSEALDIIKNREVPYICPEELPFLPDAMRDKLHSLGKDIRRSTRKQRGSQ